jgi:uncharacterized membrane protein YozB (DUF420 family)
MEVFNSTMLVNVTTISPRIVEPEQDFGIWLGILIAALFGSLASIFVLLGLCIIWHKIYMKFFKKKDR